MKSLILKAAYLFLIKKALSTRVRLLSVGLLVQICVRSKSILVFRFNPKYLTLSEVIKCNIWTYAMVKCGSGVYRFILIRQFSRRTRPKKLDYLFVHLMRFVWETAIKRRVDGKPILDEDFVFFKFRAFETIIYKCCYEILL